MSIINNCGLSKSIRKNKCEYTLNKVKNLYLTNRSDISRILTEEEFDCGESIEEIILKKQKKWFLIEPVEASYSDILQTTDNDVRYRTHTVSFSINTNYDADDVCDLNALSLGEFIVVAELINGNAVMLGSEFVGLRATVMENVGASTATEFSGFSVEMDADIPSTVFPLTSGALDKIKKSFVEVTPTIVVRTKSQVTRYIYENGVVPFGEFRNNPSITSLTVNEGITEISSSAFGYCSGLKNVVLGEDVEVIGDSAFMFANLSQVTIPNKVTELPKFVFLGNHNLSQVTIPNSVTKIGGEAFKDTSLKDIYYGGTKAQWKAIDMELLEECFENVPKDCIVHCSDGDMRLFEIIVKDNEIRYISKDGEIVEPSEVYSFGANIISNEMISDEDGLITFDGQLTSIGFNAFYECDNLQEIYLPNSVTEIGIQAFNSCTSLTSITIPNSVTKINADAFRYCSGLTSVTIGNSVTQINARAFSDCSSLTSITIPNSVTYIDGSAFRGCTSLTSIIYNGTNTQFTAITKGNDWKVSVPTSCIVHCTDGDYPITDF